MSYSSEYQSYHSKFYRASDGTSHYSYEDMMYHEQRIREYRAINGYQSYHTIASIGDIIPFKKENKINKKLLLV